MFSDGTEIRLGRRQAPKRIFLFLARRQIETPGVPATHNDLVRAGWPGERVGKKAGKNRLYAAIKTLRQLGCEQILETCPEGYRFSRNVGIVLDV